MIAQDLRTEAGQRGYYTAVRSRLTGTPVFSLVDHKSSLHQAAWGAPLDMLTRPGWKFLVSLSAIRHHETFSSIIGKSHAKSAVAARHEAIVLVSTHTKRGPTAIGRLFNRDHATIIATLKKFGKFVPRRKISQEEGDRIMKLRREGLTWRAIGNEIGWTKNSVQSYHFWRSRRERGDV